MAPAFEKRKSFYLEVNQKGDGIKLTSATMRIHWDHIIWYNSLIAQAQTVHRTSWITCANAGAVSMEFWKIWAFTTGLLLLSLTRTA